MAAQTLCWHGNGTPSTLSKPGKQSRGHIFAGARHFGTAGLVGLAQARVIRHSRPWTVTRDDIMLKLIVTALLLIAVVGIGWIRLAPDDPARWHLDPRRVERPDTPNFHLLRMGDGDAPAPVFDTDPDSLAARLHAIAMADGATLLAGQVADRHMTYLTRSRLMGFPDYTTVLIEPAEGGAALTAFARARYGYSDIGANRARLDAWVAALAE